MSGYWRVRSAGNVWVRIGARKTLAENGVSWLARSDSVNAHRIAYEWWSAPGDWVGGNLEFRVSSRAPGSDFECAAGPHDHGCSAVRTELGARVANVESRAPGGLEAPGRTGVGGLAFRLSNVGFRVATRRGWNGYEIVDTSYWYSVIATAQRRLARDVDGGSDCENPDVRRRHETNDALEPVSCAGSLTSPSHFSVSPSEPAEIGRVGGAAARSESVASPSSFRDHPRRARADRPRQDGDRLR
jgi:hypothetical protein